MCTAYSQCLMHACAACVICHHANHRIGSRTTVTYAHLQGSDAVRLVLDGFEIETVPAGGVSIPPLGLRSSRASLSVASERYKAACGVVAQELRAHGCSEPAIADVQQKLAVDPVMKLASVRPCTCCYLCCSCSAPAIGHSRWVHSVVSCKCKCKCK